MPAPCPHAERCTGCPLISLGYDEQLAYKSRAVARACAEYPALDGVTIDAIVGADTITGYRVRAKLVVGSGGALGLFGSRGHQVVDIPQCPVLTPELAGAVAALRGLIREPPSDTGAVLTPRADGGALTAIDLREARSDRVRILVSLIVDAKRCGPTAHAHAAAKAIQRAEPRVTTVALSPTTGPARVLGAAPRVVCGELAVSDEIGGVAHFAAPGAFVQAHRGQAAKLHAAIAQALAERLGDMAGKTLFDLYGGSGAIGLALARAGARVTVVESYEPAAALAARAGLAVIADDAALAPGQADVVVVDPPRKGLAARVRAAVTGAKPALVAYVSCQPETLARDLDAFALLGYACRRILPFDMIPHSAHVEALALLEPGPRPLPRVLYEDAELVIVDKPAHEPTAPQGAHACSLLERVRALPGSRQALPLHRLDSETSGVNVFAKSGDAALRWQPSLARAKQRYLALVRGISRAQGSISRPLRDSGGEETAHTRHRRLEVAGGHSLIEALPREGRKHQVRRHLAGLGHPVIGDARYGHAASNRHFEEKHGLDRLLLHLARLELPVPQGDETIEVSSPLPPAFIAVLQRVGFCAASAAP